MADRICCTASTFPERSKRSRVHLPGVFCLWKTRRGGIRLTTNSSCGVCTPIYLSTLDPGAYDRKASPFLIPLTGPTKVPIQTHIRLFHKLSPFLPRPLVPVKSSVVTPLPQEEKTGGSFPSSTPKRSFTSARPRRLTGCPTPLPKPIRIAL